VGHFLVEPLWRSAGVPRPRLGPSGAPYQGACRVRRRRQPVRREDRELRRSQLGFVSRASVCEVGSRPSTESLVCLTLLALPWEGAAGRPPALKRCG
jgi:hypothetical protein